MADSDEKTNSKNQNIDLNFDEDLADAIEQASEPGKETSIDIDEVIKQEDPSFEAELANITSADFAGVVIEQEKLSDDVDDSTKAIPAFRAYLSNLPKEVKNRFLAAAGVMAVLLPLALLIYMGKILPTFELPYNMSMGEITQKVHTYPTDGVEVPLFDPYRTQAFTLSLPKAMINLKTRGDDAAYGEFQFFLNLRDKEVAATVSKRQSEVMDVIQRTLEQITWQELQTPTGKEKVKKVVRHRLNEFLEGNIVLGVYYQSVLLQK